MAGLTAFSNAQGESYLNQYDFTPHAYTRTQPVQGWVQEAIANAVYSVDPELQIRVTSGGQTSSRDPAKKGAANGWTGSTRHNEGGAADFQLVRNGELLPISANKSIYQSVARNLAAQGVPGIGVDVGSNFIHAGGGDVAAWGYQGSSNGVKYLDPDFATSIQEGRSMAQTGGIPRPPGMVTSPPGSSVASQLATAAPVQPKSQSNALARERSVIPPGLPPALGAGMAKLASSGARDANLPVPALPSQGMNAARNGVLDKSFAALPQLPSALGDQLAMNPVGGGNQKAPMFDAGFDERMGAMRTFPAPLDTQGMFTARSPAPATGLDGIGAMPGFAELAALPQRPKPEIMTNDMALMRNPSQNPHLGQQGAQPFPLPRPAWMPRVGTQLSVQPPGLPAPRPMPASMRPQTRAPLRITVNGGSVIRPPMPSLEDRITGRAYERSSNNSSLSSI